jgi:phosphoribosyl-ATP pyrophosphohydrolase
MVNTQLNFCQLFEIIQQKLQQPKNNSYTCVLASNPNKLVQKIGEEGVETTIAGLLCSLQPNLENSKNLIHESCDLIYHLFVLLASQKISLEQLYSELYNRNKSNNAIQSNQQ